MKRHERDLLKSMAADPDPEALKDLLAFHDKQIAWLQHERLAHLLTMLFVFLFFILALAFTLFRFSWPALILTGMLLILSLAYLFHYYRLENTVQRWYSISSRIRARLFGRTNLPAEPAD
jgi:cell division protein FtsW (lipid II flippase)